MSISEIAGKTAEAGSSNLRFEVRVAFLVTEFEPRLCVSPLRGIVSNAKCDLRLRRPVSLAFFERTFQQRARESAPSIFGQRRQLALADLEWGWKLFFGLDPGRLDLDNLALRYREEFANERIAPDRRRTGSCGGLVAVEANERHRDAGIGVNHGVSPVVNFRAFEHRVVELLGCRGCFVDFQVHIRRLHSVFEAKRIGQQWCPDIVGRTFRLECPEISVGSRH